MQSVCGETPCIYRQDLCVAKQVGVICVLRLLAWFIPRKPELKLKLQIPSGREKLRWTFVNMFRDGAFCFFYFHPAKTVFGGRKLKHRKAIRVSSFFCVLFCREFRRSTQGEICSDSVQEKALWGSLRKYLTQICIYPVKWWVAHFSESLRYSSIHSVPNWHSIECQWQLICLTRDECQIM